jgi:hypothetical protein
LDLREDKRKSIIGRLHKYCYWDYQMKKDDMSRACSRHERYGKGSIIFEKLEGKIPLHRARCSR